MIKDTESPNQDISLSREDFVSYAKHSKGIKEYVDKTAKENQSNTSRTAVKIDTVKIDKALAAFKVDQNG